MRFSTVFRTRCHSLNSGVAYALLLAVVVLLVGLTAAPPVSRAATTVFPRYPEIEANIRFWEAIYDTHSVHSSVIHDRNDVAKIYTVVQLKHAGTSGAEQHNRRVIRQAVKRYKNMLFRLSRGRRPANSEEQRIADMFYGKRALQQMSIAAENVRSQTGQKERFRRGVERSGAYMAKIRQILKQRGLPEELAYLPHVESSFNTKAYSKFGASGIWQFTRATGKQYLQISEAVDERRDPLIAADAAARYLKNSYHLLGSWPLALTAYNYGTAGMLRAQTAMGTYPKIFAEYREGHFGFASRNFYSEFLAALRVAQKLENDPQITFDSPTPFITYRLPGYISADNIMRHFNLAAPQLRKLNPALREPVYTGRKLIPRGYTLRLPDTPQVASLRKTVPGRYFHGGQKKDALYTVKRGDTAGGIAVRHKVLLRDLLAVNSLDRNARIYIGQRLRIPNLAGKNSSQPVLPYLTADASKRFSGSGTSPSPPPARQENLIVLTKGKKFPPAAMKQASVGPRQETIIVHPEESLALYAHWLNLSEDSIRSLNNLTRLDSIQPGQSLTIRYTKISAAEFASLRSEFARDNEEDFFTAFTVTTTRNYTVKPGDTLWDLCNKIFNIPLWLLKKYNPGLDYARIHISQQLTVPVIAEL